jgi:hypothetical protein
VRPRTATRLGQPPRAASAGTASATGCRRVPAGGSRRKGDWRALEALMTRMHAGRRRG